MVLTTPPISFSTSVAPVIIGGTEEVGAANSEKVTVRNDPMKSQWHTQALSHDFRMTEEFSISFIYLFLLLIFFFFKCQVL